MVSILHVFSIRLSLHEVEAHPSQPLSTFSKGNRVKIRVRGTIRAEGTVKDKQWESSRREWDYMVQTDDGTTSWIGEDDLEDA